ncbi:MAG TPA: pyridoxamine 5'-phosphate oxidase family protein [Acidimicrobiales bacterium]|nr:pyridoxamine 5'-phosphate oxidase family protein [Acidimicrobiales bacterium]
MGIGHDDRSGVGFEALGEGECLELLSHGTIGRVAVTIGAIPAVFPVNYQFVEGAVHFRTGEGAKLAAATRNHVVAFQVDEIDRIYHAGWSVLAVGTAEELNESVDLAWATQLPLRAWAPGVREHFVRIIPEFVSGRRILAGHSEARPWP